MPRNNTRFAVVAGTIQIGSLNSATFVKNTYMVSYMGVVLPATYTGQYPLVTGDMVVIDRRYPSTQLTIVGRCLGDDVEGSPYNGTGGVVQPHDAPGAGSAGTPPIMAGGYWTLDIGPGLDNGHIHG